MLWPPCMGAMAGVGHRSRHPRRRCGSPSQLHRVDKPGAPVRGQWPKKRDAVRWTAGHENGGTSGGRAAIVGDPDITFRERTARPARDPLTWAMDWFEPGQGGRGIGPCRGAWGTCARPDPDAPAATTGQAKAAAAALSGYVYLAAASGRTSGGPGGALQSAATDADFGGIASSALRSPERVSELVRRLRALSQDTARTQPVRMTAKGPGVLKLGGEGPSLAA